MDWWQPKRHLEKAGNLMPDPVRPDRGRWFESSRHDHQMNRLRSQHFDNVFGETLIDFIVAWDRLT